MTAIVDLYAAPVIAALLTWWFGTGVVLLAERLGSRWALARAVGAGFALAAAVGLCLWSLGQPTEIGAYAGFAAGVAIWGWHELAFVLGWLAGPNRAPCPQGARGWRRFSAAAATVMHHELALVGTLAALAAVSWSAPNQTALAVFAALWVMRISAKLNLFLGVPNVSAEFAPPRLRHMASYFRVRRMNALFPFSIVGATFAAALAAEAAAMAATPFERVGACLLATLLALAVLEHWFMVLPVRDTLLWRWALGPRELVEPDAAEAAPGDAARDAPHRGRRAPSAAPPDGGGWMALGDVAQSAAKGGVRGAALDGEATEGSAKREPPLGGLAARAA